MMKAEWLLLRAGRIEVAVELYKENNMWDEAIRVYEQYGPNLVDTVKREIINEGRFTAELEEIYDEIVIKQGVCLVTDYP